MQRCTVFLGLTLLAACRKDTASVQGRLEAEFEKTMTAAVLTGKFTSLKSDKISSDKYTVEKVTKVGADIWLIHARIQYGEHDVTAPVPVKVLWAGDTPVLTLTDAGVPGMGTFTARVLIYRNQYAGTWSSSKGAGGQMFGKIERR
jgi:hypothetical protein